MQSFMRWMHGKVTSHNPFELGISMTAYYVLVFFVIPLLSFAGLGVVGVQSRLDVWMVSFLGLMGLVFGYWIVGARISWKKYRFLSDDWNVDRAKILFCISLAINLLTKLIRVVGGGYNVLRVSQSFTLSRWYSAIGVLDWFGPISLLLAWCLLHQLRKDGNTSARWWKWLAWGLLAFELIYAIPTCKRIAIIFPLLLVLIFQSFLSRLSWIKISLAFAGIVFFVFPLGNLCRNPAAFLKYAPPSIDGQIGQSHNSPLFIVESFLSRLNYYDLMGHIIDTNDAPLFGKDLSDFFISLGPPRFLWKTKPIIGMDGNAFGRHVGILKPDDFITSVGPNVVGDLYMNFRSFGVLFGMMLLGFLWRAAYEVLIVRTRTLDPTQINSAPSLSGIFLYAILWIQLMRGFEDSLAPMYAGLIKLFIILLFLIWFLRGRRTVAV